MQGVGGHLGRSFPLLLGHAQVLQAEAGLVALGTHSARLVVQGLGALCADGLRSYPPPKKEKKRVNFPLEQALR